MKRRLISMLLLVALMVTLIPSSIPTVMAASEETESEATGKVYVVKQDGTGDFTTIQAAADIAQTGDTIIVHGGTYREEVIFPRGGTSEDARITLKAAEGEEVTVTGSEIVSGWTPVADQPGVWSITIPGTIFEEDVSGTFFNPYAVRWQSSVRGNYPTCGTIYLNDAPLEEVYQDANSGSGNNARKGLFVNANTWKLVEVDEETNDTVVWANFGDVNPNAADNVTESNARKQVITGAWNIGYITVDGFTVLRGCAPKAIDFWRSDRAAMSGGIATNGGYYWIIENCNVSQCRGVAVDFGLGSRTHEVNNGGTPDVYGYHIIRNNKIYDNQSNGIMAYCGPYTEIYGNALANNNAMNTTLLSEAYIKDVNGGWGIKIYDNYFYSDKTWGTLAIWLDSETDGCVISNNVFYSETGGFNSTYGAILYETCHGWNVCSNNIVVGGPIRLYGNSVSDTYVINNLVIDGKNASQLIHMGRNGTNPSATFDPEKSPVPVMSTREEQDAAAAVAIAAGAREIIGFGVEGIGFLGKSGLSSSGSEGATYFANGIGVGRSMRPIVPGELTALGTAPIPEYRDYNVSVARLGCTNRYNKLLNNIFFDSTVTGSGTEVDKEEYISDWVELTRNYEAIYENGSRSSVFYPATARAIELTSTLYRQYYPSTAWGNRADYNAYYKGASSNLSGYITGDGFVQDGNSVQKPETGGYEIEATPDSFKISLTVDESVLDLGAQSYLTVDTFGPAAAYKYLGVEWYPEEEYITKDFFGNERTKENNVIGPFADLKAGENTYQLWPKAESHEPTTYIVNQDGSGDFTTIQAAANIAMPGDTIIVHGGTYREEVVFPRGGTSEDARITLKAAEGEEVIVTGSDTVQPNEWTPVEDMPGVYKLVKPNSYFPGHRENRGDRLPGWTSDLDQFNPFNSFWRSRANSSSPSSGSGASQKLGYVSCGQVYLNGEPMNQRWSLNGEESGITNSTFGTVAATPGTWIAHVDVINDGVNPMTTSPNGNPDLENGNTTIYVNFGDVDPRNPAVDTEINVRMQCLTAEWNLGYITLDGFTVMRGAGPKTVDFWQIRAEGMFGAISTNGGYHWIIENCDVTQCRGVAIDFGNGSRGQEERYGKGYDYGEYSDNTPGGYNGNGPDLYGYHIIRYCNVFDNATNGMFAYRGAYTEIHDCTFVNNNAINTGLASEAYFKDVSGGFGINLHDNYFYSDQSWNTMPIWMDCECDDVIVANNVVYAAGTGSADGFSNITYELNAGWNLFANNIIINCGVSNGVNGNMNIMNNLLINTGNYSVIGSASQARAGAEGGSNNAATISDELTTVNSTSARNRTNRVVEPGTLNEISTVGNPTSRFDGYSRYNKFMGNILFGSTSPNTSGTNYDEATRVTGYGEFVLKRQDECEPGHVAMPDFSGGVASFHAGLPDVVEMQNAGTIFDWVWVYAAGEAGKRPIARTTYGNMADWNVHYGMATRPAAWEQRGFESHGVTVPASDGINYVINGDKDSFSITLNVDESAIDVNPPLFTSEFMGPSDMKINLGFYSAPPSVDKDILGNLRTTNVAGPFANLKAGENVYQIWPRLSEPEPDDNFNPAGFVITGDPESENGATWTYKSTDKDVEYDINGVILKPVGEGPFPAVIISHGSGGNASGYSLTVAQEMVKWGLVCIAPNYTHAGAPYNQGTPSGGNMACPANLLRAHKALDILGGIGYVDTSRVAIHGHSMGAYLTGGLAAAYPNEFLVASHSAGAIDTANGVDITKIKAPYQSHHGSADRTVRPELGIAFDAALEGIVDHEIYMYEGQEHNDVRYDPLLFSRVRAWYAKYGMFEWNPVSYEITSPIKTIVAGCAANIPAVVTFAGEAAEFELGLYNPAGELVDTVMVSGDGRYTFKVTAADVAVAGDYVIKTAGAEVGIIVNCVEQPKDLWTPVVTCNDNVVTTTFASDVAFNAARKNVKINDVAVDNNKVNISEQVVTITDVTAVTGQTIVMSGVVYPVLFPSYSFTFTLFIL